MNARYAPRPEIIETNLPQELILLDPRSQEMFSLNSTGRVVWQRLTELDESELAALIVEAYETTPDQATGDVQRILRELLESGLIEERK